ncbi:Lipopolysaccharide export system permease protein LptF [Aquicella siphonis]|uniref:Lipopolysaccharide export system permease protein LptF n=1 Tax=Aquicella siphonis TaxID=254247 RepID=A0A5E4PHJ9_9COXI|nr:LPS export ABC transporter permease LptF [Aquicella siphonis]VVC75796.1 Lipopolysaccharide export system permease protein LptF [Aquicella siphonis]
MIIARYLTREIIYTLLGVTIVLLLAFLSQQMVRYLNYVAIGKIPTSVLLELASFEAPYILSFLLPLGLYLGILLAFGRLYADSEMAILEMYGYGQKQILRLTLILAVVVSAVVLFLMIWVNPLVSAKRQQVMTSDEATVHLVQTMIPGRFQASPDGTHVMYVEKLSRDRQRAENVFLAQEKSVEVDGAAQTSWMLVLANEGYQIKDSESQDQFFVTTDGYRYEGVPGQNDYKIIQFKKYAVRIPDNEVRIATQENAALPTSQLWRDYAMPRRAAEFQWRFSIALSTLFLALLAVPMSAIRPRQGRFMSLIPAVLVYIVYINLLYVARHWVMQGSIPVSIGMWWVHGVMLLFVGTVMFVSAKPWLKKS